MSYAFVSKLTCSAKEKQQIQLRYWQDIIQVGMKNSFQIYEALPRYLAEAVNKTNGFIK